MMYQILEQHEDNRIDGLGISLDRLVREQLQYRANVEERWTLDILQYEGMYTPEQQKSIQQLNEEGDTASEAFINLTRPKTTAAEARVADMLFPADDRNWGIQPTPIPNMGEMSGSTEPAFRETENGPQPMLRPGPDGEMAQMTVGDYVKSMTRAAKVRASAMQEVIEDQLVEASFQSVAREVIHDAALMGMGVLKGPVPIRRTEKRWVTEGGVSTIVTEEKLIATVRRVDPWDFVVEASALNADDIDYCFERRFLSRQKMIKMAREEGVSKESIQRCLELGPKKTIDNNSRRANVRQMTGTNVFEDNRYEVWEYHGPISLRDIVDWSESIGVDDSIFDDEELSEITGIMTFCNGVVLRVAINPLETDELPYSIFCWEKDEASPYGLGVPYLMRDQQEVVNGAWRMMMDNAALSTGPQVVYTKGIVEPQDGNYRMSPRKVWIAKGEDVDVRKAFYTFNIQANQAELAEIIAMARTLIDEETSLPLIAQGEKGSAPDTATGMSMLMNAANTVLRRIIKRWDDDITRKLIRRFYDWNMQNNEREDIKGDMQIDARGSSVLLVREIQQQTLIQLMRMSESQPWAGMTKHANLYRKAARSMHVDADDVIKTDEELREEEANAPPPEPPPEIMVEQMRAEQRMAEAQMRMQADMQRTVVEAENARILEAMRISADQDSSLSDTMSKLGLEESKMQIELIKADLARMKEETARMKLGVDAEKVQAETAKHFAELKVKMSPDNPARQGI